MKRFDSFHPVTILVYFLCVIFPPMFLDDPVILSCSLLGSLCLFVFWNRSRLGKEFLLFFLLFLLIAAVNPLFSHNGKTILFFLNGNAVTLEAILYGVSLAAMITSVFYWFRSFSKIMTSDKFLYLFGRATPKVSVILSSALRYLPLFRQQTAKISKSQTAMGLYSRGSLIDTARGAMRIFSIMVTWSLENAVDTADSMRARGYGSPGRTSFSLFRFRRPDLVMTAGSLILFAVALVGILTGEIRFAYYPEIRPALLSPSAILFYSAYGVLAFLPFLIEVKENIKWICCKLKI